MRMIPGRDCGEVPEVLPAVVPLLLEVLELPGEDTALRLGVERRRGERDARSGDEVEPLRDRQEEDPDCGCRLEIAALEVLV